ncbi:transporter substrate-binding domain-containing protein [Nocardiopsis sp. B62]|uniref:transporter substrate-binding domain-containing protein n=1 Tax=Nocardiopsis sp. B62 TaxID=2824874 RepID=UPI001B37141D|nr:transporter substrate-binding domain-containing protein [Nocardiopsis sp. B62]MBQ1081990.1 transporter substrate-binding domain-containing protein [Nocardiopsis sp. B62]
MPVAPAKPRTVLATTAASLTVLLAAGCSGADSDGSAHPETTALEGSRLDDVLERGSLNVCTTGDYRPFTFLDADPDEFTGIDVDMARDLADDLGVEIEWTRTTWDDLMDDFLAGCDVAVGGISISTERAQRVYFSAPLMEDGKTPITLCENVDDYRTIEQINQPGVRSIMPSGGTNQVFAQEHYPDGELVTHDNNTIFDEIVAGRADVMTTDASEVRWVANEYEELCAVNPEEPFDFFEKAFMLPRGDEVFKHYVDQWLNMALNDGTYDRIVEPWFGEDVRL